MTNRDYLMGLSNEELAKAIGKCSMACNEMKCESDCQRCCLKWLEKERKPNVEKWQIRKEMYRNCFWLILYINEKSNWCMAVDEHGHISKIPINIVLHTWVVWDVKDKENIVNKFLERIYENL